MKTGKMMLAVMSMALIVSIALCVEPAFCFEKEEMDMALREELSEIDDLELRAAILDEYREVLIENMPELAIEDATCVECEEDLKELEQAEFASIDDDMIEDDREVEEPEAVEAPEVEPEVEPDVEPEEDPVGDDDDDAGDDDDDDAEPDPPSGGCGC